MNTDQTVNEGYTRKPEWLKIQLQSSDAFRGVKASIKDQRLHTVCEEAKCPNIHECWGKYKTATFMILGDTCTRRCRFCAVKTGLPPAPDIEEPKRVAESALAMGLEHVVITMVNRDDLADGGSDLLVETIHELRKLMPKTSIEILSSDMMGREESILKLVLAKPEILSHNVETVRRLTPLVRSRSLYERSLEFLRVCATNSKGSLVKSSLMLGLGETEDEILETAQDLISVGVRMCNIGQYLQPSRNHLPVQKYWTPEEFVSLKEKILGLGMEFVEAGPLVRSSFHAGEQLNEFRKKYHPLYKDN